MKKNILFVATTCLCLAFSACKDSANKEAMQQESTAQSEDAMTEHDHAADGNMHHHEEEGKTRHHKHHHGDKNATKHQCNCKEGNHSKHSKFSDTESGKMLSAMHAPMMKQKPSRSKSAEIDFITDMIPHHQGAIDAAKLTIPHAKGNEELEMLLQNIIAVQEEEIKELNSLLSENKLTSTQLSEDDYKDFIKKSRHSMHKMMKDMGAQESGDVSKDFLTAMITHHQGAVNASKIVLDYTKDETVRKIANDIISAQEAEIVKMNELMKKL
ncbi:DUF305 domain-containing protein [Campylobacter troglodytis]|uniref:DUF305 domain-containing protein n=1 Tax=Campylobacter troglodytis TaxID=654363 RepID=UPI00115B8233|nr:DUF305 domain-containing protein [Campylobacter troglodytis]TQR54608.1 DUF305 domain-containing protein [Campylobacter troglodytis]